MYDFDKVVNRRGTNCEKWDGIVAEYGTDAIPMWVADMDFEVAPAIQRNLQKIVDQKIFGYQMVTDAYYNAIMNWMDRRHHYKVQKEWIVHIPNVVVGLSLAVQAVSKPGDDIIVLSPTYGPFFGVVKDSKRNLIDVPLRNEDGYYTMDYEAIEASVTPNTKALLICNPHNPSGRVWTREELEELAKLCIRHNLYIVSDDIHSDLVTSGYTHTMMASLSEEAELRTITCTSPSKPFNLASMQTAYVLIADEALRARFEEPLKRMHLTEGNAFTEALITGAYNESEQWLDEMMAYVEKNMEYFVDYVRSEVPMLSVRKSEGTYLQWVDCRNLDIEPDKLKDFFAKECGAVVNDGAFFGEEGKGFVRFNLACSRSQLKRVLPKIKEKIQLYMNK